MHYLILHSLKLNVSRFVGTVGFLIRYFDDRMKQTRRRLKKFLDYF